MKSRTVVSILIPILIASVLAASYLGYTTVLANPPHGFTLLLTGKAYDPQKHIYVNVALSVTGTADGKLKTVITLHAKSGAVTASNYGTFSVTHGCGELVSRCHYIELNIWLAQKYYGGKTALWCLSGKTGTLSSQTLHVSLYARHVVLPITGYPRLDNLSLMGTIAPIY